MSTVSTVSKASTASTGSKALNMSDISDIEAAAKTMRDAAKTILELTGAKAFKCFDFSYLDAEPGAFMLTVKGQVFDELSKGRDISIIKLETIEGYRDAECHMLDIGGIKFTNYVLYPKEVR